MKRVSKIVLAAALIAFAFGSTRAMAGATGETITLPVQASVTSGCLIGDTGVNFGAISPLLIEEDLATQPYTATGSITLACGTNGPTVGSDVTIALDTGANGAIAPILGIGTSATAIRAMTNGTDFLAYDLFLPVTTGAGTSAQTFTCTDATTQWTNGTGANGTTAASGGSFELLGGTLSVGGFPTYAGCIGPAAFQVPACTVPVCASISGDQVQPLGAGIYTDTVTATVSF